MNRSISAKVVLLVLAWSLAGGVFVIGEKALGEEKLTTIQAEVDALKMLHDLQATDAQLRAVQQLASETKATGPGAEGSVDAHATKAPTYAGALTELRDALLSNNDDKIYAAEDKVEDLLDQYDIDDATCIPRSRAAQAKSADAIKIFGTAQWANWVAENSFDAPDPTELLQEAIKACRGLSADDFAALRQQASQEIAMLIEGPSSDQEAATEKKISDLLDQAHELDDAKFASRKPDLEKSAKEIVGSINPGEVIQHWMLGRLADLLSNPELDHAVNERLSHSSDASKKE